MGIKLRRIEAGYEVLLAGEAIGVVAQTHPPLDRSGRWAAAQDGAKRRPEWLALDAERCLVGPTLTRRMAVEILRRHHRARSGHALA